jgi:calcineurin-like phosphoesterase family protein
MIVTNRTWVISDTHFGHRNIVNLGPRPDTHEIIMLDEWIRLIGEHDTVLHLGDVCMGPTRNRQRWFNLLSLLPGNVHFIKGNHDSTADVEAMERIGWVREYPFIQNGVLFTHFPTSPGRAENLEPLGWWDVNVHGHIHNNGYQEQFGEEQMPDKHYVNVSVEATDFRPVQYDTLKSRWADLTNSG